MEVGTRKNRASMHLKMQFAVKVKRVSGYGVMAAYRDERNKLPSLKRTPNIEETMLKGKDHFKWRKPH